MEFHTVEGTIEELRDGLGNPVHGSASTIGVVTYAHVKFVDKEGAATVVTKLKVHGADSFMQEGNYGVFLISKSFFGKKLVAVRVGNEEITPRDHGLLRGYIALIIFAAISLAFSFAIVGIPFLLASLWGMVAFPSMRAKQLAALKSAGFGRLVPDPVAKVI